MKKSKCTYLLLMLALSCASCGVKFSRLNPYSGKDPGQGGSTDVTPPEMNCSLPYGPQPAGTREVKMTVTTNESAACRWDDSDVAFSGMAHPFQSTGGTSHVTQLTGLSDGQFLVRYVRCQDPAGNATPTSRVVQFSIAAPGSHLLWSDDIQNGDDPWGFGLTLERPMGTHFTPETASDDKGVNLSKVSDPQGSCSKALRHYAVFEGGARAQAGIWSFANPAFDTQAKSAQGVYVAQEMYFPKPLDAGGNWWPWISIWDWHSVSSTERWFSWPSVSLARDGSMKVHFEWSRAFPGINPDSDYTQNGLPIGRWVDLEMYYKWSIERTTLWLWIDGKLAIEQSGVQTRNEGHTTVETYSKWYGDGVEWTPSPSIRYTRSVRFSDRRITGAP